MGGFWDASRQASDCRCRRRRKPARCCIHLSTSFTSCCARSFIGAEVASSGNATPKVAMLIHLQIRDFAIIDAIELELRPGLTVLTGETGAGKSILVDALQLLAGGRAGAEVVRHGAERAEISGTFDLAQAPRELKQWLEEQSLGGSEDLIIRRGVAADGRSRAYLNGQSVPLQLLREAGNILIDIHGQHDFQSLMRSAAQRELLDGYGML